ncbi:Beta-etherase [Pandoraea terrae]|uniref:Beta-etherase n=1 Tax=Pandoraea terrae TaxID=1537710 RepID=A0A5E4VAP2_9BURK|nr:glutathione S-transferase N-terminal domain-containing protein [Pandoraea terrae]VVE09226.1 Beta-etherase [Pandoraea terrae]
MSAEAILYELAAADDTRFSPFCWRTRWGLQHKGLSIKSVQIGFPDIGELGGPRRTVPVIQVGDAFVEDSWDIAVFLDERFPDRAPLLGCPLGQGAARFVECFTDKVIHPTMLRLVSRDVFDRMSSHDRPYFRQTREVMLGCTLEEAQATRDQTVHAFRKAIHPIRLTLNKQPWLAGEAPGHADYIVLAAFQWGRLATDFKVLEDDDPIAKWFQRGLDLHDGFGRKVHPDDGGPGFAGVDHWEKRAASAA